MFAFAACNKAVPAYYEGIKGNSVNFAAIFMLH